MSSPCSDAIPDSGDWGERILPDRRFFLEVDHNRWLNSSLVAIGLPTDDDPENPEAVVRQVLRTPDDVDVEGPVYETYRIDGGTSYVFTSGDFVFPALTVPEGETLFWQSRPFEGYDPPIAHVLIFESGLELVLHPQTLDALLARTDSTDPVAVAVLDSMRKSLQVRKDEDSCNPHPDAVVFSLSAPFPEEPIRFEQGSFVSLEGPGTVILSARGHQVSLTLPEKTDGSAFWLVVRSCNEEYHPALNVAGATDAFVCQPATAWLVLDARPRT